MHLSHLFFIFSTTYLHKPSLSNAIGTDADLKCGWTIHGHLNAPNATATHSFELTQNESWINFDLCESNTIHDWILSITFEHWVPTGREIIADDNDDDDCYIFHPYIRIHESTNLSLAQGYGNITISAHIVEGNEDADSTRNYTVKLNCSSPTEFPTGSPTVSPTDATNAPSDGPTVSPTRFPSTVPSESPIRIDVETTDNGGGGGNGQGNADNQAANPVIWVSVGGFLLVTLFGVYLYRQCTDDGGNEFPESDLGSGRRKKGKRHRNELSASSSASMSATAGSRTETFSLNAFWAKARRFTTSNRSSAVSGGSDKSAAKLGAELRRKRAASKAIKAKKVGAKKSKKKGGGGSSDKKGFHLSLASFSRTREKSKSSTTKSRKPSDLRRHETPKKVKLARIAAERKKQRKKAGKVIKAKKKGDDKKKKKKKKGTMDLRISTKESAGRKDRPRKLTVGSATTTPTPMIHDDVADPRRRRSTVGGGGGMDSDREQDDFETPTGRGNVGTPQLSPAVKPFVPANPVEDEFGISVIEI